MQGAKSREEADALDAFREGRELARSLQGALDSLFFSHDLQNLTRKYLVF